MITQTTSEIPDSTIASLLAAPLDARPQRPTCKGQGVAGSAPRPRKFLEKTHFHTLGPDPLPRVDHALLAVIVLPKLVLQLQGGYPLLEAVTTSDSAQRIAR